MTSQANSPELKDARLTVEDRVATLTFCRDDVRNALTGTELIEDILKVSEWLKYDTSISALIITGEGKGFSSGGNVKDMQARTGDFAGAPAELAERYRLGIQRISLAVPAIEVPTIAAVNGAAVGAGFDLACMCDIRIASRQAKFGETFLNLGIIPGDGGAWFLQQLVGYQRAAELTFSGRVFDSEEALAMGLLLEVTEVDQLVPRAQALAASFASQPPQALRMAKKLMKSAQRMELRDFLDLCAYKQAALHHSDDHQAALSAFFDKTTPTYTGK